MAIITRREIVEAFERLGQLASAREMKVELALVGGALMTLVFGVRDSTHDIDAIILAPAETRIVRELAKIVADERGLPDDWLNDGAKAFLIGVSPGPIVFEAPGIEVRRPSIAQLLAMKLSAWRDDVDVADARRLLQEMAGDRDRVWRAVEPFLVPGNELKAEYAFADLWEALHGKP